MRLLIHIANLRSAVPIIATRAALPSGVSLVVELNESKIPWPSTLHNFSSIGRAAPLCPPGYLRRYASCSSAQ